MRILEPLIEHKGNIITSMVLAIFISLFVKGHAVESIAVIALVAYSLILLWTKNEKFIGRPKLFRLFIIYFVFIAFTGIWANDKIMFLEKVRTKSVLLGIPFAFLVFKTFNLDQFRKFSYGFVIFILLSMVYVVINYFNNFELILKEMLQGHPVPVPFRSHVRYSILLNIALMVSLHRANLLSVNRKRWEYILWVSVALVLFIFIQFLAVKIGLVISYIVAICFAVHKILQTKEYLLGAAFLTSFCLISVLAMSKLPTIKNKIAYVKYDLKQYKLNDTKNYSDGDRIMSFKKGIDIIREYPWLGVGEGNVPLYLTKDEHGYAKLPHNQFILTWAQNGVIGVLLLLSCFIYSILSSIRRKNWLLFSITVSYFVACMVESMLETQIGAAVFILPWVMFSSLTNVHEK